MMSRMGRKSDPNKIAVIKGLEMPTYAKGIAKLLGYVGWYKELIPAFAKITVPIIKLFRKDVKFEWTEECERAFGELKACLSTYPVLVSPN